MVIVRLAGGLGNQFYQYVAARSIALKLNTELKLDLSSARIPDETNQRYHNFYRFGDFNIVENIATPEEIKNVKEKGQTFAGVYPKPEEVKGNIYLTAQFSRDEKSFADILDIIRKDFTLKKPFNPKAEAYRQKILAAECSVSMHLRHGDFAYQPAHHDMPWAAILPLDYYYTCIDILKQRYSNLTVFVFSDNVSWVKKNLKLDVPTEFIEGVETDHEEWLLMSLCKHNINASSTFSLSASQLNANPDKKVFGPHISNSKGVQSFLNSLTPERKNALIDSGKPISVPIDYDNRFEVLKTIKLRPWFSLCLVMNNDAATIADTLDSLLNQDYKYYEVIIIDNASTDGSRAICRQKIAGKENVTFKKLYSKVKNSKAWNIALRMAQGYYVSFLKGNDYFLAKALPTLYGINYQQTVDMIHLAIWLEANDNGEVTFDDKKFSVKRDRKFQATKLDTMIGSRNGQDAARMMLNQEINSFLSTKFFYREFLLEHKIKFDKQLNDDKAELLLQTNVFLYAKTLIYSLHPVYVLPKNN